ncbi:hypothetical protein [Cupriavidus necator]
MINAKYLNDHLEFIQNVRPEFGKSMAKLILENAIHKIGSDEVEEIEVPLKVNVREMKLNQCVEISVNGVHIGHIGI